MLQFHDETWSIMLEEMNAIEAILYARGASGANSQRVSLLQ